MFISRATRRDYDEMLDLLAKNEWEKSSALTQGVAFIARQGPIIGMVRVTEVAPQTLVVEQLLIDKPHRGKGIGSGLMTAAMNSRGGTIFLACHDDVIPFYERLEFTEVAIEECPDEVVELFRQTGDYPTEPGHVHHFMRAR
jgi:N-acetylglutamate synthase-like GNAT family acetyltransferase